MPTKHVHIGLDDVSEFLAAEFVRERNFWEARDVVFYDGRTRRFGRVLSLWYAGVPHQGPPVLLAQVKHKNREGRLIKESYAVDKLEPLHWPQPRSVI